MIGKIKGILVEIDGTIGLIETQSGLSYQVFLTSQILNNFKIKSPIDIYTYHQVREDAMVLFGFAKKEEHTLFKMLLSVSGVGPKTAFSIVSFTKPSELYDAIKSNNVEYFTRIPGLGKKTALKIILELSQKLKSEFVMKNLDLSPEDTTVVDALVSLGFKNLDAKKLLSKIPTDLSVEEKIQKALTYFNTSKT